MKTESDIEPGVGTVIILLLCLIGYIANIVKLCHYDFEQPFKAEAIRITGVFVFPVGMVCGFISIDDSKKSELSE